MQMEELVSKARAEFKRLVRGGVDYICICNKMNRNASLRCLWLYWFSLTEIACHELYVTVNLQVVTAVATGS